MGNKPSKATANVNANNAYDGERTTGPDIKEIGIGRSCASSFLTSRGIRNLPWLEYLLHHHGSTITVEDVCLLVPDLSKAVTCLSERGYLRTSQELSFLRESHLSDQVVRLTVPQSNEDKILLLDSRAWHFGWPSHDPGVPSLNVFLDSLMETWLNMSRIEYQDHLEFALYLANLVRDFYRLQDQGLQVKSTGYADQLKIEHRELHYDIVGGQGEFANSSSHHRNALIYREIKAGRFSPKPHTVAFRPQLGTLKE